MQTVRRPLIVMHPDRVLQARVRQAAGKEFSFEIVSDWAAMSETLPRVSLAALVVVDPYLGCKAGLAPELRVLLGDFPTVAVLAALEVNARRYGDLRLLGKWGVMEVILLGEHDVIAIATLLRSVRGRPLQSILERALPANTSGRARSILYTAAEVAAAGGQSDTLARALHGSMRTLLRWCDGQGLPPPRRILGWMRILLAAEMLEDSGRSVEGVALACGYASDSGLRRAFSDFLGESLGDVRRKGPIATASHAFRQALDGERRQGAGAMAPVA